MKRLVVCCDGTWNSLNMQCPTNVVKLIEACKVVAADGTPQLLYYDSGVGTDGDLKDKWFGGAFGWGIDENIQDAYRFLCLNYAEGDQVYLFGFSRGAYTVRSLAGMVYCSGLLPHRQITATKAAYDLYRDRATPSSKEATEFRETHRSRQIDITLIGCWDTVGSLGIPKRFGIIPNRKYEFHDVRLNRKIRHALHAVAIDERRRPFDVARMERSDEADTKIIEAWFPGTHGCVGGGTASLQPLSNATLLWMVEQIQQFQLGLEFDQDWLNQLEINHTTPFSSDLGFYKVLGAIDRKIDSIHHLHLSVKHRYRDVATYRPKPLSQPDFKEYLETFISQMTTP